MSSILDRKGRKITLKVGLLGMPIMGVLGVVLGYPFYKDDISIVQQEILQLL